jgi:hypothetical protein
MRLQRRRCQNKHPAGPEGRQRTAARLIIVANSIKGVADAVAGRLRAAVVCAAALASCADVLIEPRGGAVHSHAGLEVVGGAGCARQAGKGAASIMSLLALDRGGMVKFERMHRLAQQYEAQCAPPQP